MRARSAATADAELLASAIALRWSRPDLTAALAEHVAATWAADDRAWVAAAGWLVHGRAAVGDGRDCASDILAELARRLRRPVDDPAADRLRIEVAALAAAQCEPAVARLLVEPLGADRPAEVRADALGVLARCAFEDRPAAVGEATRRAAAAWERCAGPTPRSPWRRYAAVGVGRTAGRTSGRGYRSCRRGLGQARRPPPGVSAPHLATALAAEWITALVEAGRTMMPVQAVTRWPSTWCEGPPTRQTALLRLTVARALAASASPGAFEALEQAAADASACDTPDLEGLCHSTLGRCTSRLVGSMRRWSRCAAGSLPSVATGLGRNASAPRSGRYLSEPQASWPSPSDLVGRGWPSVPSAETRSARSADRASESRPRGRPVRGRPVNGWSRTAGRMRGCRAELRSPPFRPQARWTIGTTKPPSPSTPSAAWLTSARIRWEPVRRQRQAPRSTRCSDRLSGSSMGTGRGVGKPKRRRRIRRRRRPAAVFEKSEKARPTAAATG